MLDDFSVAGVNLSPALARAVAAVPGHGRWYGC